MPMQLTQRGRQAKSKVEIDQRFSGVFSDPKFKRQTVVDKRGRATGAKCVMAATASACCKRSRAAWRRLRERTDDLRRFYRLPDEDAAGAEARAVAAGCSSRVLKPPPPSCLRMLRFKTTTTATTPAQAT